VLLVKDPTAVHAFVDAQDTPLSCVFVASGGLGVV
jgi:hypothetical protein